MTYVSEFFPPLGRCDDSEHHLRDVEGVPPVVISDGSVVLSHGHQPPTENVVINVEPPRKVQVDEHANGGLGGNVELSFESYYHLSDKTASVMRTSTTVNTTAHKKSNM